MPEVVIEYEPRPLFVPFHQRHQRWACMVVHRRSGKTVSCVNDLGAKAIYTPKPDSRYGYIAPFYRQAKDIAWTYTKQFLKPVIRKIRESELRVELINDSWITLYGADNPDSLRGVYFDGVVLDEFGDMRPSLWGSVVLPTLIDRRGWAVFIGTPRGKNQFYRIHERAKRDTDSWFHLFAPSSKTGIIPQEELEEIRLQMSEEEYEQELECSFDAALRGAIFAKYVHRAEIEGRVTPLEYDKDMPVHVAGDIGRRDATAMWFWQDRPDGIAVLDYEEHTGSDPEFFDEEVFQQKPWKKNYGTLWLPHDARAKTFATKRSTLEQFMDRGYRCEIVPQLSLIDGINAGRVMLGGAWFHAGEDAAAKRIEEGLDALRSYRTQENEQRGVFSDTPLHDWASHGADGWRYLSIIARQRYKPPKKLERVLKPGDAKYEFTLAQLWEDRERGLHRFNTARIR